MQNIVRSTAGIMESAPIERVINPQWAEVCPASYSLALRPAYSAQSKRKEQIIEALISVVDSITIFCGTSQSSSSAIVDIFK